MALMFDPTDRAGFLNLAGLMEGSLIGLALLSGWLVGVNPLGSLHWNPTAVAWGVGGAIPLFALFLFSVRFPLRSTQRILKLLREIIGAPLTACRWYELMVLALLVGFAEELLFRGWMQPWFEGLVPERLSQARTALALVFSNVIFGLMHLATPAYGLLAGLTGIYLGLLLDATGERNLLIPIVTHALYDYLAFLVIIRMYESSSGDSVKKGADEG